MRSSTMLLAAPALISAQALTTITGRVQTATVSQSGSALYTTTWTYSNPATNFLSETDSDGVVTGQPSNTADTQVVTTQPQVVTSQPAVATIPAGLPSGVTQILYNGTAGFTSFTVSVGSSTTEVIGGTQGVGASVTTGGSGSSQTGSGGSGGSGSSSGNDSDSSDSNSDSSDADASASASASESGNAASSVQVAGAGIGLFAFIAALL